MQADKPAREPAGKPHHVLVAEVVRAHGVHGAVQARLLADSWEALGRPTTLYLERGGGDAPGGAPAAPPRPVAVEWVQGRGVRLILKLAGVETRPAAAALAGCRLSLPRAAAPPLPEGHFYHYDILGLAVVDSEGQDLGRVAGIVPTGANDVYVVRGPRGEWLLPALRRLVAAVDLEAGLLRVRDVADLLEGEKIAGGVKRFDVISLFPGMFRGPLEESILRRAQERGLIRVAVHDLRDWTHDRHRVVDDTPYGGGVGMLLKPEPVVEAVEALNPGGAATVVLLSPQGQPFTQALAAELARRDHTILVCGRYEGLDERVAPALGALEVSIGDYVLTGGELPALVVIDAVTRLVPGVLGDAGSAREDSFAAGLLDHPQYTRPPVFRGMPVPEALRSGDHARIRRWRRKAALRRTRERRPDLLARAALTDEDRALLEEIAGESASGGPGAASEVPARGPGD